MEVALPIRIPCCKAIPTGHRMASLGRRPDLGFPVRTSLEEATVSSGGFFVFAFQA